MAGLGNQLQFRALIDRLGDSVFMVDRIESVDIRTIFPPPDMDIKTYELESQGYKIWFTCEVDGVEYRLAARK